MSERLTVMFEEFPRARRGAIFFLLFLSHLYFFQIYPGWISPNEVSRYFLISAVVDYQSLSIDQPIRQFFDIQDKAVFEGRAYSDKAIGTSLLGIPPYIVFKAGSALLGFEWTLKQAVLWIRFWCVILPALLFLPFLGRFWLSVSKNSTLVSLAIFLYTFGTLAFPYSLQLISHYLLGVFLFLSFYTVFRARTAAECSARRILFAGLLAGLSLSMEYPAVIPVSILVVYTFWVLPEKKMILWFFLGILPFAVLMLGYHAWIFGNPFDTPYRHKIDPLTAFHHVRGVGGITMPRLDSLFGMLFSRHRGLFFWSPILLFSIPGFYYFFRRYRAEAIFFLAVVGSILFLYSGFYYWVGGWNLGSRYLASLVPFLATPAYLFLAEQNRMPIRILAIGFGLWSVLLTTIGTITFPYPPPDVEDPFFQMFLPLFLSGSFGLNLGDFAGIQFLTTAILFFVLQLILLLLMTVPSGEVKGPSAKRVIPAIAGLLLFVILMIGGFRTSKPSDASTLFSLGRAYYFLGYYQDAYRELSNAMHSNPDPALQQEILSYLSKLR